jgi:hypothetical protein
MTHTNQTEDENENKDKNESFKDKIINAILDLIELLLLGI